MKRILRASFRTLLVFILFFMLLVVFLLNPQVMYAKKRLYNKVTLYSQNDCPAEFNKLTDQATNLIKQSELYDSAFQFDVFINDGSAFPSILKKVLDDGCAWGYHNNVVLNGVNDESLRFIQLNGHQRHLARTIAHEMIHCLQANHYGIFGSRPVKNIPHWKWEGYPEYIAYSSASQNEDSMLIKNLELLDELKNEKWYPVEVQTADGPSFAGIDYFRWWLMVKYCIDVKRMSFTEIIKEEITYDDVYNEMMQWYADKKDQPLSPPSGP